MSPTLEVALTAIRRERERQDEKWGVQDHSLVEWLAILAEEFGEASKDINEFHFRKQRLLDARLELIQTAAVAVAMLEYIDRHSREELERNEGK